MNVNTVQRYEINPTWCATAFLDDNEKGMYSACPRKITNALKGNVNSFYESKYPVIYGSFLLVKSALVHLRERITQVFLTAITGLIMLVTGIGLAFTAPIGKGLDQFAEGGALALIGVYLLTFGLAADGVLAATSPLMGIYEATRVIWSRAYPTENNNDLCTNNSNSFNNGGNIYEEAFI